MADELWSVNISWCTSTFRWDTRVLAIIMISFQASPELGGEAESGQFYPDHGSAWVWCALGRVWWHLVQPVTSWREVLSPPLYCQLPRRWTFLHVDMSWRKCFHGATDTNKLVNAVFRTLIMPKRTYYYQENINLWRLSIFIQFILQRFLDKFFPQLTDWSMNSIYVHPDMWVNVFVQLDPDLNHSDWKLAGQMFEYMSISWAQDIVHLKNSGGRYIVVGGGGLRFLK